MSFNIFTEFNDNTARFFCRVYYVEQFRNLRKLIFPAGEDRWVWPGNKHSQELCRFQPFLENLKFNVSIIDRCLIVISLVAYEIITH